jgi:hypothetical protein
MPKRTAGRLGADVGRRWLSRFAALAIGLATAACAANLPGTEDAADLEVGYVSGWGYYSRFGNTHSVQLDALVIHTGGGNATLKRWSFTLQRRGETIATLDETNLAQYGLGIADLETKLDSNGGAARVSLGTAGATGGRAFYGADPPDQVIFRCTVDKARGSDEDLRGEGTFQHSEN